MRPYTGARTCFTALSEDEPSCRRDHEERKKEPALALVSAQISFNGQTCL